MMTLLIRISIWYWTESVTKTFYLSKRSKDLSPYIFIKVPKIVQWFDKRFSNIVFLFNKTYVLSLTDGIWHSGPRRSRDSQ